MFKLLVILKSNISHFKIPVGISEYIQYGNFHSNKKFNVTNKIKYMFIHRIDFFENSLVDKMTVTENSNLTEIVYGFMRRQSVFYLSLKFKYYLIKLHITRCINA